MSYCINPHCEDRYNPNNQSNCHYCGCSLIIKDRYRIIKPLRLDGQHNTEIFEVDDGGRTKILKVLTSNRRRLVKLFEQERKVLAQLEDLPISRLDNYFTFVLKNSRQKLRCLVMEKVEGKNLQQWIFANGKLTEPVAINWLRQLLTILGQVHQQQILHRDIKPSNIMVRPDGKLIAIDFGTARKLTSTYVEKLERADVTIVYSSGYTAPEQYNGQAVYRSDIFALGRTFVHLMTGVYPDDLPKADDDRLIWHDLAPQISNYLKDIIDRTISLSPTERPTKAELLELLNKIDERTTTKIWRKQFKFWQRGVIAVVLSSLVISGLVISIRELGWLQPSELQAFDRLMSLRAIENFDPRLLLITVDEADIQYQNQQNMSLRWSLSDEALAQLLVKINQYHPRTIGIDIYRDFAVSDDRDLAKELQTNDRLYAVCKVPAPQDGTPEGTPPPPEVPLTRIGFSDLVADSGDIVRRQLLHLTPPDNSSCQAEYAFSFQLALDYLSRQGIRSSFTSKEYLQIGETIFKPIGKRAGGYQNIDAAGYQVLLNYRSLNTPTDIAQQISLKDVLDGRLDAQLPNLIKNRLILIGVTAASSTDDWQTPYSQQSSSAQKQVPGVFVQAQMTSQIISAVIDNRPLIWWWSEPGEIAWIWGWSLVGAILGWYLRRPLLLGGAIALALLALFTLCLAAFTHAGWILSIPPAIALILTSILAMSIYKQTLMINKNKLAVR